MTTNVETWSSITIKNLIATLIERGANRILKHPPRFTEISRSREKGWKKNSQIGGSSVGAVIARCNTVTMYVVKIVAAARQNAPYNSRALRRTYVRWGIGWPPLPDTVCESFYDQVPSAKLPSFWQNHDKSNSSCTPFRRGDSLRLSFATPWTLPYREANFDSIPIRPFFHFSDSFATRDRDVDEYSRRETSPPNRDRDTLWILSWRSWRRKGVGGREGQEKKCRDFSRQHPTHNWAASSSRNPRNQTEHRSDEYGFHDFAKLI